LRRTRESSVGTLGRSNYEAGTSSVRVRESSLTRGGRFGSADTTMRNSVMIPTSMETAKFNREQEMKEIHSNFMKQYNTTKAKVSDEPVDTERRSKAYQRIINNEPPRYLDEMEAKKACVSEMFMDTSKFSTKTLSAINGLEGAVLRNPNKEYNWRKEMNEYEKRAEFERDVRARNVSALHRDDKYALHNNINNNKNDNNNEDHWVAQRKTEDRKRQSKETTYEKPIEKVAKKENNKDSEAVKSWREKREAERAVEKTEPEPEKKSWREKLAEKQKQDEEEKKQKEADDLAAAAIAKAAKETALAAAAEESAADVTPKPAEAKAEGENAEDEEEDHNGTKQLKSDVGFLFTGLEQEFEAGKSKLAKLRERIKKAKTAIKEADDADTTEENKESEAEKDKRRAELREKFRLQREAKKKAQAESQK